MRADVFLDQLDAEHDNLFEEIDNKSFTHTTSECCCLLIGLFIVKKLLGSASLDASILNRRINSSEGVFVGFLPSLALI